MEIWQNQNLDNLEGEIWKPLLNYESLYEISNLGRIKSLIRKTKTKIIKEEKILRLKQSRSGYIQVKLCKESKIKMPIVSRLVAEHFLEKPAFKYVANHKNNITWDNRVENLELISQSQNIRHSYQFGNASQKGEKNNNAKITKEIAEQIRLYFTENNHLSQREIAEVFGLKREHIKDILLNKIWK